MDFNDALKKFKEINIGLIILTSVDRDGTLEGFNQNLVSNYLNNSDIPLIISGGIKDENDLKVIKELKNKNIFGVILGKSLYENKIDLKKCIQDYENVIKRIIPCLDIDKGRVVKGINFEDLIDAGDSVEILKI